MANVKSNYAGILALPNGQVIAPGKTIAVENWDALADHHVVKAWLAAKVIEVEGGKPVEAKANEASEKTDEAKKGK